LADVRHEEVEPENHQHERQGSHQVHVARGELTEHGQTGQSEQGQRRAQDQAPNRGQQCQQQRETHAFEKEIGKRPLDDIKIEGSKHGHFPAR
jgi:hypothetical protein